jgi:hypothetical protein
MNENETATKGRPASHPTLLAMARTLQSIEFASPLTEEENAQLKANAMRPQKNITLLPGSEGASICIRMSFLGRNRNLGVVIGASWENRCKAARFADMCRVKFWPYKMRDRRPPRADELNLSPARAEIDLKNETKIVALLNDIERFMLSAGLIKLTEIKSSNKERKQQTRAELQSINIQLSEIVKTQGRVLNTLENRLDGLQQVVMGIQKDNSVLIMAVSTILEKLANPPMLGVWSGSGITYPPPQNTCCIPEGEVRSLSKYES